MMIMFYQHVTGEIVHVIGVNRCYYEAIFQSDPIVTVHDLHIGDHVWMCRRTVLGNSRMDLMFAMPGSDWEILSVTDDDLDWYENVHKITMSDDGIAISPDLKPSERNIPHEDDQRT